MFQSLELVNVEGYSDWIRLVAEFTLKSLQSWQVGCYESYVLPIKFGANINEKEERCINKKNVADSATN